jgi:hypothetical protein
LAVHGFSEFQSLGQRAKVEAILLREPPRHLVYEAVIAASVAQELGVTVYPAVLGFKNVLDNIVQQNEVRRHTQRGAGCQPADRLPIGPSGRSPDANVSLRIRRGKHYYLD